MIRTLAIAAFTLLISTSALAQSSQFGILFGGSKHLTADSDKFKFSNSVREIYYGINIEPGTVFKIKAGRITAPVAFNVNDERNEVEKGTIEHIDGLIDYRFSEAFGSTGLFAGVGLYRQKGNVLGADETETNYGFSGGVNADFPLTRRSGVVVEAAYHWVNVSYRPRYVTLSGGLRFSF
jgi:hypothetical protein